MTLRMIGYGLAAGFSLLLGVALLEWLLASGGSARSGAGGEADISAQVWQVLAEARRIVEESA
jgi:hypothetical protein